MISFKNGIINISEDENRKEKYDEIRSAVYDNKIPLIKVIGYKSVDIANPNSARASDRNNSILENMIELSGTFSELILLPYKDMSNNYILPSNIVNIEQSYGRVTADSAIFKSNGKQLFALNKDLYLFFALQQISIRFIVEEGTDFSPMEKSVESIKDVCLNMPGFEPNSYFPLNNEFSLIDYIRILPPTTNGVFRYNLVRGMTDSILNMLWSRKRV